MTPAVQEWAAARHADLHAREFGNSLRVGPDKALGQTGAQITGFVPMIRFVTMVFGHKAPGVVFLPFQDTHGTWLYAYHRPTLERLLLGRVLTLTAAGWPWHPRGFVTYARDHLAPTGTDLYALIADCYGDKLNPGRADVLPGVPRRELLAGYLAMHGEPDPSFIYFPPDEVPAGYPRRG